MTDSTDALRAYVRAALQVQGYEFNEERIAEITLQFARIEAIARTIHPLAVAADAQPDLGPAAVFRP
jgi:alkylhydroperoxidase family enzyme